MMRALGTTYREGSDLSFTPLWNDGPIIAAHALLALFAVGLGGFQLAMEKGTLRHRSLGYVWVSAMGVVALSSFWIHELRVVGPFSPIHLLSVLVLFSLVSAVLAARRGNIRLHRITLVQLYIFGLILTGAFTFMPGRTMHAVLFGG
ncbi:MAG: DUF2306 domain-containing protein [Pseudomonadota bacterium]